MARVHASAVVEPGAELGSDVVVGPFCHVGPGVILGDGTELSSHVVVLGPARLGKNNRLFPFAVLGAPPQDRSYRGENTRLEVGDDNVFREHVTLHRGTLKDGGVTRIGSRNLFMVGSHVAHDCNIADDVVLTNSTLLGGHVVVEANVVSAGNVAVAPFVRLGRGAFIAGGSGVERDVPPFVIVEGNRARVRALNRVGLERMGVPETSRHALKTAFRLLWRSKEPLALCLSRVKHELGTDPWVSELVAFMERT